MPSVVDEYRNYNFLPFANDPAFGIFKTSTKGSCAPDGIVRACSVVGMNFDTRFRGAHDLDNEILKIRQGVSECMTEEHRAHFNQLKEDTQSELQHRRDEYACLWEQQKQLRDFGAVLGSPSRRDELQARLFDELGKMSSEEAARELGAEFPRMVGLTLDEMVGLALEDVGLLLNLFEFFLRKAYKAVDSAEKIAREFRHLGRAESIDHMRDLALDDRYFFDALALELCQNKVLPGYCERKLLTPSQRAPVVRNFRIIIIDAETDGRVLLLNSLSDTKPLDEDTDLFLILFKTGVHYDVVLPKTPPRSGLRGVMLWRELPEATKAVVLQLEDERRARAEGQAPSSPSHQAQVVLML